LGRVWQQRTEKGNYAQNEIVSPNFESGYLVAGVAGATAAALGIFLPVYLVVVILAPSYKRWAKNPQLNAFV